MKYYKPFNMEGVEMKRYLVTIREIKNGKVMANINREMINYCDADDLLSRKRHCAHEELMNERDRHERIVIRYQFNCVYGYEFVHMSIPNHSFTFTLVEADV